MRNVYQLQKTRNICKVKITTKNIPQKNVYEMCLSFVKKWLEVWEEKYFETSPKIVAEKLKNLQANFRMTQVLERMHKMYRDMDKRR